MQMQLQKKQATSSPSREKSVLANHLTLDLVFNAQDDSIFLDRMIHSLPNSSVTSPSSLAPVPTLAPSFPSPSTIEHVAPHQSSPSCSMCRAAACTLSANSDQENGVGECLSEEESASSTGLPSSPLRGAKQPVLIFLSVLQEVCFCNVPNLGVDSNKRHHDYDANPGIGAYPSTTWRHCAYCWSHCIIHELEANSHALVQRDCDITVQRLRVSVGI